MDIDAVTSSYARWAPVYDRTFGAITEVGRRKAAEYVNRQEPGELLEVGVGTGLSLPRFDRGHKITGVDYSHDMLAKAETRVGRMGLPNVEDLRQMDARKLDFDDDRFDTVVAMHVISVVPDPDRVMAEMVRVLKPGGRLVMTNHFARERGVLGYLSRRTARFADQLGWHSDFDIRVVTDTPGLREIERRRLPPLGMMTLLVLEKDASALHDRPLARNGAAPRTGVGSAEPRTT
ncbi:class I SAM-dependent methyltransferase [Salipiger mucosus]|uniref:Phosphatidylethanolamine N-methyltransferase n=1 Tax=Salipiger mucosus DSM 16094 TaxID=1123237 RepID=S9SGK5_9RHOB|nr:class I SAM-dependent methyltransferase [Salipiger mucosus]EPX85424.1 Phosphatidylethanolamine N-methyltransferase [Salipiger mucosus DSM 16094]